MSMPWVNAELLAAEVGKPPMDEAIRAAWAPLLQGQTPSSAARIDKVASKLCRKYAIPTTFRTMLWLRLSGGEQLLKNNPNLYNEAEAGRRGASMKWLDLVSKPSSADTTKLPRFGGPVEPRSLCLSKEGLQRAARVLLCLQYEHSEAVYCPFLPTLVIAALHWMSEEDAFAVASGMLRQPCPLVQTRVESWLRLVAMDELAKDVSTKAYRQLCAYMGTPYPAPLDQHHPLGGAAMLWMSHHLPFWPLMRFLDNFIVEGEKSFYRFGLAILHCWRMACPHVLKPDLPPLTSKILAVPIHGLTAPERGSTSPPSLGKSPTVGRAPAPLVAPLSPGTAKRGSTNPADPKSPSLKHKLLPLPTAAAAAAAAAATVDAVDSSAKSGNTFDLDLLTMEGGRGRSDSLVSYASDDSETADEAKKHQQQEPATDDFDILLKSGVKTGASSLNASADNMAGLNVPLSIKEAKEVAGEAKPTYALTDAEGICTPAHIAQNIADAEKLVELAFSFGFSRDDLKKATQLGHRRAQDALAATKFNLAVDEMPPSSRKQREQQQALLRTEPVVKGGPGLLSVATWRAIWKDLPSRYNLKDVTCIFDTSKLGYSLTSFFACCGSTAPTVMCVKALSGEVFGAFLSYGWDYRLDEEGKGYFGSGETFVFQAGDAPKTYLWVGDKDHEDGETTPMPGKPASSLTAKSGKAGAGGGAAGGESLGPASFFMHGSTHRLCVGGGSTGHAIELDATLKNGRSQPSETFGNPSFVRASAGSFQVAALEVWAFAEHH